MSRGILNRNRWLLARRTSQLSILALFLLGPLAGIWIVKGNLASSLTLETLPLTDPYVLLQSLFASQTVATAALTGAAIVLLFYILVGGRVYCSWVCPVNIITDAAGWLRRRLQLKSGTRFSRQGRYWILALTLILAAATGTITWELVNPVSMTHRAIIFGVGLAWLVILSVFLLDFLVGRNAWCGHLCPVGAFYSIIGKAGLLRVSARQRNNCDDCMDCFEVCPESQVIRPALKVAENSPVILSPNCTNCGRCIDVCDKNVFSFSTRFEKTPGAIKAPTKEAPQ